MIPFAVAAAVLSAGIGLGADRGQKPLAVIDQKIGSVHALMGEAFAKAKKWAPDAALVAIFGSGPSNLSGKGNLKHEVWTIGFASPSQPGLILDILFRDGEILSEAKNSVHLQLDHCVPIGAMFVDTPALEELAHKRRLRYYDQPGTEFYQMLHYELYRPSDPQCWGVWGQAGSLRKLYDIEPIPKKLAGRALWVVQGYEEALFVDAATGKFLHKIVKPPAFRD